MLKAEVDNKQNMNKDQKVNKIKMMDFVILKKHLLIAAVINQMLEDIHNSKMKIVMMIHN